MPLLYHLLLTLVGKTIDSPSLRQNSNTGVKWIKGILFFLVSTLTTPDIKLSDIWMSTFHIFNGFIIYYTWKINMCW